MDIERVLKTNDVKQTKIHKMAQNEFPRKNRQEANNLLLYHLTLSRNVN